MPTNHFRILFTIILLALALGCTNSETESNQPVDTQAALKKISSHIKKTVDGLVSGDIDRQALSRNNRDTGIVRVDSTGSIHCYVYLTDISAANSVYHPTRVQGQEPPM